MQRPHSFLIGQEVEVNAGQMNNHVPRGAYTILRQLPNDAQDRDYRVKNAHDGHERVVQESQLTLGKSLWARHTNGAAR